MVCSETFEQALLNFIQIGFYLFIAIVWIVAARRCLRLWVRQRNNPDQVPQQLSYLNFVPDVVNNKMFGSPKFLPLNDMVEEMNAMLRTNPLPGEIITIETQVICVWAEGLSRQPWGELLKKKSISLYFLTFSIHLKKFVLGVPK